MNPFDIPLAILGGAIAGAVVGCIPAGIAYEITGKNKLRWGIYFLVVFIGALFAFLAVNQAHWNEMHRMS